MRWMTHVPGPTYDDPESGVWQMMCWVSGRWLYMKSIKDDTKAVKSQKDGAKPGRRVPCMPHTLDSVVLSSIRETARKITHTRSVFTCMWSMQGCLQKCLIAMSWAEPEAFDLSTWSVRSFEKEKFIIGNGAQEVCHRRAHISQIGASRWRHFCSFETHFSVPTSPITQNYTKIDENIPCSHPARYPSDMVATEEAYQTRDKICIHDDMHIAWSCTPRESNDQMPRAHTYNHSIWVTRMRHQYLAFAEIWACAEKFVLCLRLTYFFMCWALCVCLCVYVCEYVCVCVLCSPGTICVCTYLRVYIYIYIYIYIIWTYMHACIYV